MPALSDATPPKPKTPAIIARTRKIRVQSNNGAIHIPFYLIVLGYVAMIEKNKNKSKEKNQS